jgi:hypothetical protein
LSLKENLDMVKEELSSEEKFFEKAVVTEKFVKKYKNAIIGAVVAVVVVVVADLGYEYNKQQTIFAANETLAHLQQNTQDTKALAKLKSLSPTLHDVWLYSQAVVKEDVATLKTLEKSSALIIPDVSDYEVAQNTQDLKALEDYSQKQNGIYTDMAHLEAALILMHDGKVDDAHAKLAMIAQTSPLAKIAKALMHYGVK